MPRILDRLCRRRLLALALAVMAAAGMTACARRDGARPAGGRPEGSQGRRLEVLAFYDGGGREPDPAVLDLLERYRGEIDYLVPAWYQVRADGTVADGSDPALRAFARRAGIPILPLFSDAEAGDAFLLNPAASSRAVREVADILRREGYPGAGIDFRPTDPSAREALTGFLRDLSREVRPGKLLAICLPPGAADGGACDFAALARDVDRFVVLAYDRPAARSTPGPVAPLEWVEQVTRAAVRAAGGPERVILGLAAYGYDRAPGAGQAPAPDGPRPREPLVRLKERARQHGVRIVRNRDGSPHYSYTADGVLREVWFEDEKSVQPKIRMARRMGLAGLAVWQAGSADRDFWEAVRRRR